jgi:hypothetical protein
MQVPFDGDVVLVSCADVEPARIARAAKLSNERLGMFASTAV